MDVANSVENAIQRFYINGENDTHLWLLQIQTSLQAWDFVWYLLDASKSWEVQFFGANTLYTKISKYWHEVPNTGYETLKARIISCIKQPNISKLVFSKLCQSLSTFFANINASEQQEKSKCLIEELTEIFPYNESASLVILLQILSFLPQEFEKRTGMIKTILRDSLINSWSNVSWLLVQVFTTCNGPITDKESDDLYIMALECTNSWLKLGQIPVEIAEQIYPYLLQASARYISSKKREDDSKGFDLAQDCLTKLVEQIPHRRPQLFWNWAKSFICMVEEHGAQCYYELLMTLGEGHGRTFVLALAQDSQDEKNWIAKKLLDFMLQCSNEEGRYPVDEKYSAIPFGFWYTLQDDITTLDPPLESQAMQALKPFYAQLVQILLRKSELPTTAEEAGGPDERELFRCYRQDVADTYTYCHKVLAQDLFLLLGQRLSKAEEQNWVFVESTIFAFKSLSECIEMEEQYYVPAIMGLILGRIQYDNYPKEVLACACSTLGSYAEWIGENVEPWLEKSLQLIMRGLTGDSITSEPASMALKDITRECNEHVAPMAPTILDLISRSLPMMSAISEKREGYRLMHTAGNLIKYLVTQEEQIRYLESTLGFCIMNLRQLLQQPAAMARVRVSNHLNMISTFLSTLDGPIGKLVLDALLPLFNQIISQPDWSVDESTLEEMYSCAKNCLLILVNHPEIESKPLLTILSVSFKIKPHPAALDLLRNIVVYLEKKSSNEAMPIFVEMSSSTLACVADCQSKGNTLSELSDFLEAYFKLLAVICKKNMRIFLGDPDQIPQMLRCGIACLSLPEQVVRKSAAYFLMHAISQSPHLQTFIQPIGQELVCMIVQCISGKVPLNSLEHEAEVLLALIRTCPQWSNQWLRNALFDVSGPSNVTADQKEVFLRDVCRQRNKWNLYEILNAFSLQLRQNRFGAGV